MATKKAVEKQVDESILVFKLKIDFQSKSDAEIRLAVKTLKAMLLTRQQERASRKYLGSK
jgi:hypothetical protein